MKIKSYPIQPNLVEAIRVYLSKLILEREGETNGDQVFVAVAKKSKRIPRRTILSAFETAMSNAFILTVTQDRRDEVRVREFFSLLIQAIDVNWHADGFNPDNPSDQFPLFVCIRHHRFDTESAGGFELAFFISMDSTTMEIKGDHIDVNRDEIYDDLDVLALKYVYQP